MNRHARRSHPLLALFWWLTLLFLYLPLAVVVVYSFNAINSASHFAGFSLRWYEKLFQNHEIFNAFYNSMVLAICSSLIALLLGSMLGYGLYRHRGKGMGWLVALIYLPIVMPDVVFGLAEMTFFVRINSWTGWLAPGLPTMILSHVTFELPFVALLVYSRFVNMDGALFEAARDLYAGPFQRFTHVVLPEIKPALFTAFFLSFTLSFDDFSISFFTSGPESATLPIYIWSSIRRGISPEINAVGSLMIAAVMLAAFVGLVFKTRSARAQRSRG